MADQIRSFKEALANTANLHIAVTQLKVTSPLGTPANSTSTTVPAGVFWSDNNYLYVSTANNVVKRLSLSSF